MYKTPCKIQNNCPFDYMVLRGSISKCQHIASVGVQFLNMRRGHWGLVSLWPVVPATACRRGLLNVVQLLVHVPFYQPLYLTKRDDSFYAMSRAHAQHDLF